VKVALIHIRFIFKGGLETRLFNYLEYFLERGDEVTLFTSKVSTDVNVPAGVEIRQVEISKIPKFIRPLWFNYRLCPILDQNEFDFVLSLERTYCQDNVLAPSTHAGFLRRLRPFFRKPGDYLQLYLDRQSFQRSKRIFACSQMVKNEIVHYYKIPKEKITVLFPPLNTKKFFPISDSEIATEREKQGIEKEKFVCLFVSTGHKRKGLNLIYKMAKELGPDFLFLVAGTPFQSHMENVRSMGFVKSMNVLYNIADLTVHPAVYEPFGQIISESLATRTPVVVSERTGAKEVIEEGEGQVIHSRDEKEWAAVIREARAGKFKGDEGSFRKKGLDMESHMNRMLDKGEIRN
jgi:glycosyltransferase involved in cell wall biosynthesis